MADHSARIAEIDAILRAGARSVSIDGHTVTYDFDALRGERARLISADDTARHTRPRVSRINLSRFP